MNVRWRFCDEADCQFKCKTNGGVLQHKRKYHKLEAPEPSASKEGLGAYVYTLSLERMLTVVSEEVVAETVAETSAEVLAEVVGPGWFVTAEVKEKAVDKETVEGKVTKEDKEVGEDKVMKEVVDVVVDPVSGAKVAVQEVAVPVPVDVVVDPVSGAEIAINYKC